MTAGALFRVRSSTLHRVGIRKLAREGQLLEMGRASIGYTLAGGAIDQWRATGELKRDAQGGADVRRSCSNGRRIS